MTILNADRWLYERMTTDSQLAALLGGRVYMDVAPQGVQYPLAVITFIASRQIGNLSVDKIMDSELWQIALWTNEPSYTGLEAIADQVRDVLHQSSGTGVIGAVYEDTRRLMEQDGDTLYKSIILEFRLFTQ
jgi:hypothetical protein